MTSSNTSFQNEYDYSFKILTVGESGTGKSSLLLRFADNTFTESFMSTIGVDFKFKHVNIDGKNVKLVIWDTAGQERFQSITKSFYRGANGFILVFDLTDLESYRRLEKWIEDISRSCPSAPVILVGNKADLDICRAVDTKTAQLFAKQHGFTYMESSAKTSQGVNETFTQLAQEIIKNMYLDRDKLTKKDTSGKKGFEGKDLRKKKSFFSSFCTIV